MTASRGFLPSADPLSRLPISESPFYEALESLADNLPGLLVAGGEYRSHTMVHLIPFILCLRVHTVARRVQEGRCVVVSPFLGSFHRTHSLLILKIPHLLSIP